MQQRGAKEIRPQDVSGWLDEQALWDAAAGARSSELSALFINRYAGRLDSNTAGFHGCWELLFVFRGAGTLWSDAPLPLRPGYAILIPPGVAHREECRQPADVLWVGLRGTCLRNLPRKSVLAVETPELAPVFEQLWLRAERRYGRIGPELDGLARAALGGFLRMHGERKVSGDDLMDQAIAHLHANYAASLSVARLAARIGFSEGYFFRLFKRRTGLTPNEYLTRLRIDAAKSLLRHSSVRVARVARLVGYADPLYFSRAFRKATGRSPRAARRQ